MNTNFISKSKRGSIVRAAGATTLVGLLAAGSATLGAWQDHADAGIDDIRAANVTVAAEPGAWYTQGNSDPVDPATYKVGSNETLTWVQQVTAASAVDGATLSVVGADPSTIEVVFPGAAMDGGFNDLSEISDGVYEVPAGEYGTSAPFELTITTGDSVQVGSLLDLSAVQFVVTDPTDA